MLGEIHKQEDEDSMFIDQKQLGDLMNQMHQQKNKSSHNSSQSDLAPIERVPKDAKAGYKTIPSMKELSRMTLAELSQVKNFTIGN